MGNASLSNILKQMIRENGLVSFRDYMEAALYHPGYGYYMTERAKLGADGDFYTSCFLGPVFGAMIARQILEMWQLTAETAFTIVEYGAGDGRLCSSILSYFHEHTDRYDALQYFIIEKSPYMCELAKFHLPQKVRWLNSLVELGGFTGCVLSNELLDNFAVHRVVMQDVLKEIFIDVDGQDFVEVARPAGPELLDYFTSLGVELPAGYWTEVNLEAKNWLLDISRYLIRGYVLTIDYGYLLPEFFNTRHCEGTLVCYQNHTVGYDYYNKPGLSDITSHVNFSALIDWGETMGLNCSGLTGQAEFLLALGFKDYLRTQVWNTNDVVQQALHEARLTRLLLVEMGNKFKALIQAKGMAGEPLCGLKSIDNEGIEHVL